jgi:anti-sigma factor RsiW
MSEQIETLFVPYVLGTLTTAERQQVDHYIARHPAAEARLAQLLEERLEDLEPDLLPMAPPAGARDALLSRIANDRTVLAAPAPTGGRSWFRQLLPAAALTVFGILLFIAAGSWINNLNQQLAAQAAALARLETNNEALGAEVNALRGDRQALETENSVLSGRGNDLSATVSALDQDNAALLAQLASQAELVDLISSPRVETVAVGGTAVQPAASGQLVVDPESSVALLIVSGLDTLPEGEDYQVLLITGAGHTTHETFRVNADGQNVVVIRAGAVLLTYDQLGISVEPAGGSPQRTGDIVMLASLPEN